MTKRRSGNSKRFLLEALLLLAVAFGSGRLGLSAIGVFVAVVVTWLLIALYEHQQATGGVPSEVSLEHFAVETPEDAPEPVSSSLSHMLDYIERRPVESEGEEAALKEPVAPEETVFEPVFAEAVPAVQPSDQPSEEAAEPSSLRNIMGYIDAPAAPEEEPAAIAAPEHVIEPLAEDAAEDIAVPDEVVESQVKKSRFRIWSRKGQNTSEGDIATETRAAAEEERVAAEERAAAEAARVAEEARAAAEAARVAEEERVAAEERAAVEAARVAEEERVAAEEHAAAEAARVAAEEHAAAEAARVAEEERVAAEAQSPEGTGRFRLWGHKNEVEETPAPAAEIAPVDAEDAVEVEPLVVLTEEPAVEEPPVVEQAPVAVEAAPIYTQATPYFDPAQLPAAVQQWNLWELEVLVKAVDDSERAEELSYLLYYLRDYASPDGSLDESFDSLVRESFGDLLAAQAQLA